MSASPVVRTPLSDFTGCMINYQQYHKCGEFEMDMMECLEAYGMDRGRLKCKDLIEDFQECAGMNKQYLRMHAMLEERNRQYKAGILKEKFAPPPQINSF